VIDGQGAALHFEAGKGAEGNRATIYGCYGLGLAEPELTAVLGTAEGLGAAEEAELPEDVVAVTVCVPEEPVVSAVWSQSRTHVDVL